MGKVSIVIPFYNGDRYIEECLNSLSVGSCGDADKVIVNNSDKPTRVHSIAAAYEKVTIINAGPRLGFGRACNLGAELSLERGAEYIILLNQDSTADQNLVSDLIAPFNESADLVLTAPIPYDHNFSSVTSHFVSRYVSTRPEMFYDALKCRLKNSYELDSVTGACIAIRSEFIRKHGLFDPIYFMYWEDDDLCRRIKYLHYDIALIPGAKVAHHNQAEIKNHCPEAEGRQTLMALRHSRSIFKLKDTSAPLIKTCLKICFWNLFDYAKFVTSLNLMYFVHAFVDDIRLTLKLPCILRSRTAEMDLIKRGLRERLPGASAGSGD